MNQHYHHSNQINTHSNYNNNMYSNATNTNHTNNPIKLQKNIHQNSTPI